MSTPRQGQTPQGQTPRVSDEADDVNARQLANPFVYGGVTWSEADLNTVICAGLFTGYKQKQLEAYFKQRDRAGGNLKEIHWTTIKGVFFYLKDLDPLIYRRWRRIYPNHHLKEIDDAIGCLKAAGYPYISKETYHPLTGFALPQW